MGTHGFTSGGVSWYRSQDVTKWVVWQVPYDKLHFFCKIGRFPAELAMKTSGQCGELPRGT